MDRLTKEQVERCRKMSHEGTIIAGVKLRALCDLALQSLSQESVRSEALEELAELSRKATQDLWRSDCILPPEHKTRLHTIRTADDPPTRIVADGLYERDGVFIVALVNWFRTNLSALQSPARVAEGGEVQQEPLKLALELVEWVESHGTVDGHGMTEDELKDFPEMIAVRQNTITVCRELIRLAALASPESPAKEQPGEQKWIPVSERLPDYDTWTETLIAVKCLDGSLGVTVSGYDKRDPDGWFQGADVTHWMPLPPSPERP